MQAYSPALPVGAQHNYRSSFHALSSVVQNEGKLGLVRGVGSAMLRTAMVCPPLRVVSGRLFLRVGFFRAIAILQLCQAVLDDEWIHVREQLLDISR